MKNKDDFELELLAAFNQSPDWKESRETMWKNIEEKLPGRKKLHHFRNTRIAASALAVAMLCIVFFGKTILIRHPFAGDTWKNPQGAEKKSPNSNPAVEKGPALIYLRWDFNLNLKDKSCMPGQDIKLDITLTGRQEDIKIGDKIPVISIESVGTSDRKIYIEEILLPQLKDKAIKKGETFNLTLNVKAPGKPGTYYIEFEDINLLNKGSLSGGGTKFTVLAPKSEVYIKNMSVNKEINAHGNIIKIKDITMNEKETTVNYTTNFTPTDANCSVELITDTGETLYGIDWIGKKIQNGMDVSVSFNPVTKSAKRLIVEVRNLEETTPDGIKNIEGDWKLEVPIK